MPDNTDKVPLPVKALILPKFTVGTWGDGQPDEGELFYRAFFTDAERFAVAGCPTPLLYKDGLAMMAAGEGKVNAAVTLTALLCDPRFDFSKAYIISTGCAGSLPEKTVMGDVFLITATVDFDLGHTADYRDLTVPCETTWFYEPEFGRDGVRLLSGALCEKLFALVKDTPLESTPKTKAFMAKTFGNAPWATRDPVVQKGTVATGDNYWKGAFMGANAKKAVAYYGCPDPLVCSEMEDHALAAAADRFGLLDRLIVVRDSVNMTVFMNGATPESLWAPGRETRIAENEEETADIFAAAMANNFKVCRRIIEAIQNGTLSR